jgi:hypothetical protein
MAAEELELLSGTATGIMSGAAAATSALEVSGPHPSIARLLEEGVIREPESCASIESDDSDSESSPDCSQSRSTSDR